MSIGHKNEWPSKVKTKALNIGYNKMLIDDFFKLVNSVCCNQKSGMIISNQLENTTTSVTEAQIVKAFFGSSSKNLFSPKQFFNTAPEARFFGYFVGMPDKIYSTDGNKGLCIEFKVYRKTTDAKTEPKPRNNGCEVRNAFSQLLEYMQKPLQSGKTCEEGAVVVFDTVNDSEPTFLFNGNSPTMEFAHRMIALAKQYQKDIGLIWIWKERDSFGNVVFKCEKYS